MSAKRDEDKNGICFTIMPFGGWYDRYYQDVYCPAIEDANMVPKRADDLFRPSTIVKDIWAFTKDAEIILADLSEKNANVMYELGLAHAIAKPAIIVTESMDDIPFDLRALRIIIYNKDVHNWGDLLREKIKRSILEIIEDPLQSVPAAFIELTSQERKPVSQTDLEILELRQELELLKKEMRSGINNFSYRRQSIPTMTESEAKFLVHNMLSKGIPYEVIIDNLSSKNLPIDWITKTINEYVDKKSES